MDILDQFRDRMRDIRLRINQNELERDRDYSSLESTITQLVGRTEALRLRLNSPGYIAPAQAPIAKRSDDNINELKLKLMPNPKKMFTTTSTPNKKIKWPKKIRSSVSARGAGVLVR